jgi:pterin-4a-carbinolamine dehydratase
MTLERLSEIGTVSILWTTHYPRGLSHKDIFMARYCDEQAKLIREAGEDERQLMQESSPGEDEGPAMPIFSLGEDKDQLMGETKALLEAKWELDKLRMGIEKTYYFKTWTNVMVIEFFYIIIALSNSRRTFL